MNNVQDISEPRRSATVLRHQGLHDRLLAAAERAITADGLQNVRARALAEAAGCSVGAIYSVYPDLDALVLAVNGRTLDAIDAAMRTADASRGPLQHLVRLAETYLHYAAANRRRWSALFQHTMPPGREADPSYVERQQAAFSHVETPLALMRPEMPDPERALLARSLFSAVHGMVALGLDEKVVAMPMAVLKAQIQLVVEAIARGLARE